MGGGTFSEIATSRAQKSLVARAAPQEFAPPYPPPFASTVAAIYSLLASPRQRWRASQLSLLAVGHPGRGQIGRPSRNAGPCSASSRRRPRTSGVLARAIRFNGRTHGRVAQILMAH